MTDDEKAEGEELSDDTLDDVSGGTGLAITSTTRLAGENTATQDINIGVGELQECTISK